MAPSLDYTSRFVDPEPDHNGEWQFAVARTFCQLQIRVTTQHPQDWQSSRDAICACAGMSFAKLARFLLSWSVYSRRLRILA